MSRRSNCYPTTRKAMWRNTDSNLHWLRIAPWYCEVLVLITTLQPWDRDYHYSEIAIGKQYDPKSITALRKLKNCSLVTSALDFSAFIALEELDLSGNKLTTLNGMCLEQLPNLRVLDVSNNEINTPLKDVRCSAVNI